ncbi:MAG: MFS transporter [Planctomycetes bacterium]|nr:MFS transporter [Planctomycetota bacterium]
MSGAVLGRQAWLALAVLSSLNLLNYADRFVISSLLPMLQRPEAQGGLALTDGQSGWLYSAFILVYTLAAPFFGLLADRVNRLHMLAFAVAFWSVLTAAGAWAAGFWSLLLVRAVTGVGEAAYASVAPALLADEFGPSLRSRVMSVFNAAIPVGAAIGFTIGSVVGAHWGWKHAFLIAGGPGLVLAVLIYLLRDPPRGAMEGHDAGGHAPPTLASLMTMWGNARWRRCTLGYAAQTACFGSLAYWAPLYLDKSKGMVGPEAGSIFGAIVACTGLVGTLAGGWWSDAWSTRCGSAHLRVCAITSLVAVPCVLMVVLVHESWLVWTSITMACLALVMSTGPVNAQLVQVVHPAERGTGMALAILAIHLLGDVPGVPLVGNIAEWWNMDAAFGSLAVFAALAAGIWWWAAMREPAAASAIETVVDA